MTNNQIKAFIIEHLRIQCELTQCDTALKIKLIWNNYDNKDETISMDYVTLPEVK